MISSKPAEGEQVRQVHFSSVELGAVKELLQKLEMAATKKEHTRAVSALKAFASTMEVARGRAHISGDFVLNSVTKVLQVSTYPADVIYLFVFVHKDCLDV